MLNSAAGVPPVQGTCAPIDAALNHPLAFVLMAVFVLCFGVVKVAHKSGKAVRRWQSFLHFWMAAYLILLGFLMSLTTAMALALLLDNCGQLRLDLIPSSFVSMAAAALGVFGFGFLLRNLIIGVGESQLDVGSTLEALVNKAVQATLRKEVG